jgi:hypothetical protein
VHEDDLFPYHWKLANSVANIYVRASSQKRLMGGAVNTNQQETPG